MADRQVVLVGASILLNSYVESVAIHAGIPTRDTWSWIHSLGIIHRITCRLYEILRIVGVIKVATSSRVPKICIVFRKI